MGGLLLLLTDEISPTALYILPASLIASFTHPSNALLGPLSNQYSLNGVPWSARFLLAVVAVAVVSLYRHLPICHLRRIIDQPPVFVGNEENQPVCKIHFLRKWRPLPIDQRGPIHCRMGKGRLAGGRRDDRSVPVADWMRQRLMTYHLSHFGRPGEERGKSGRSWKHTRTPNVDVSSCG